MHLIKKIEQRSIARNAVILLAAITLSVAVATDGLAAGRGGRGGGGLSGGHIRGGFRGPLLNASRQCRRRSSIRRVPTLSLPRPRPPSRRQAPDQYSTETILGSLASARNR